MPTIFEGEHRFSILIHDLTDTRPVLEAELLTDEKGMLSLIQLLMLMGNVSIEDTETIPRT